jgi:heme A synthase
LPAGAGYWIDAALVAVIVFALVKYWRRSPKPIASFGAEKITSQTGLGILAFVVFLPLAGLLHSAFGIASWIGTLAALAIVAGAAAAFSDHSMEVPGPLMAAAILPEGRAAERA